jgi:hypothetical protein
LNVFLGEHNYKIINVDEEKKSIELIIYPRYGFDFWGNIKFDNYSENYQRIINNHLNTKFKSYRFEIQLLPLPQAEISEVTRKEKLGRLLSFILIVIFSVFLLLILNMMYRDKRYYSKIEKAIADKNCDLMDILKEYIGEASKNEVLIFPVSSKTFINLINKYKPENLLEQSVLSPFIYKYYCKIDMIIFHSTIFKKIKWKNIIHIKNMGSKEINKYI